MDGLKFVSYKNIIPVLYKYKRDIARKFLQEQLFLAPKKLLNVVMNVFKFVS